MNCLAAPFLVASVCLAAVVVLAPPDTGEVAVVAALSLVLFVTAIVAPRDRVKRAADLLLRRRNSQAQSRGDE